MELPERLKYTDTHEWIADNGDGTVTVGITAVATEQLGDLVYVELPKSAPSSSAAQHRRGRIHQGRLRRLCADGGEVVAANEDLSAHPENVNQSPYGNGWLFKLKVKDKKELGELMASDEYAKSAGV